MATPGRRNTDAVSNETPQLGDPYQFTDPEEEFTFSATDSSQEDFMGFNAQDCRDARRWLLFWVRESPESDSASCNEGRDIFAEGCNTLEFSENRGVNSASSSQSDSSSDPGLKTAKNDQETQRDVNEILWRKPRWKEVVILRLPEKSNPQESKFLLAAALENVIGRLTSQRISQLIISTVSLYFHDHHT